MLFFRASRNAHAQLTELFDFVWPTAAGMWNLRWQVAGYVLARPDVEKEELDGRFTQGSGIHGTNLRRACLDHSWEHQTSYFARIVLTQVFAIHESWIHNVLVALDVKSTSLKKQLQFPTKLKAGIPVGISGAIQQLTSPESGMLRDAFYLKLSKHRKNALPQLENLMLCYRLFKECRNSLMHGGGTADQRLVDAYEEFQKVATKPALGVKEVPEYPSVVLGEPIQLSLRGVVGFSEIVLKIIATVDAELARSQLAEREFVHVWKKALGRRYTLKGRDAEARQRQIGNLVAKLGYPRPVSTGDLDKFLTSKRLAG